MNLPENSASMSDAANTRDRCPKSEIATFVLCRSDKNCEFQELAEFGGVAEAIQVCTKRSEKQSDLYESLIEIFKRAMDIQRENPELLSSYCLQLATEAIRDKQIKARKEGS